MAGPSSRALVYRERDAEAEDARDEEPPREGGDAPEPPPPARAAASARRAALTAPRAPTAPVEAGDDDWLSMADDDLSGAMGWSRSPSPITDPLGRPARQRAAI